MASVVPQTGKGLAKKSNLLQSYMNKHKSQATIELACLKKNSRSGISLSQSENII